MVKKLKRAELILKGEFYPKDIITSLHRSNRKIDPKIESQIDDTWKAVKMSAKEKGKTCYNGTSYRLNDFEITEDDKLHLKFSTIKYKIIASFQRLFADKNIPVEYRHRLCSVGATLKTKDGMYVMAELSGKSMNGNDFDFLGGMVEKPLSLKNSKDLFTHLYKELKEEGSIDKKDIKKIYLRAILQSLLGNVTLHFIADLNITKEELILKFSKSKKDQDIKGLIFMNRAKYLKFLKTSNNANKAVISTIV